MYRFVCALILASVSIGVIAQESDSCETTHECAQKMLASLADLHESDDALSGRLAELAKKIAELSNASSVADASTLEASKAHTNTRFSSLGGGNDTVPAWGNGTSRVCPAGTYMVGAKVNIAGGDNAGSLYTNIDPICRAFR